MSVPDDWIGLSDDVPIIRKKNKSRKPKQLDREMSEMSEVYREMKSRKRARRKFLGQPCQGCNIKEPKRSPKILMPGQKCSYCGWQDRRSGRNDG